MTTMPPSLELCRLCGNAPEPPTDNDWCDPPTYQIVHQCIEGLSVLATEYRTPEECSTAWNVAMRRAPSAEGRLREALRKFGVHKFDCRAVRTTGKCDCGFTEAKRAALRGEP